ncbi:MAG: DUF6134 family protein [Stellaceae bacterium]
MFSPIKVPRIGRRLRERLIAGIAIFLAGALFSLSSQAAHPLQLVYNVSHPVVGNLGSYTCTVLPLADGGSEVKSREHIDARLLGIPLYRMDASDTERWLGNRLVSFDGVTEKAGGRVEVRGEAQGNRFVITSPQGTLITAATVHPAQPCVPNFLQSTTILRPDTGGIEEVRVSGGGLTSVVIGGAPVAARKYILDGKTRYTVWLDSRNVPVMFVIDDSTGKATFTLTKCVSRDPALSRVGMN